MWLFRSKAEKDKAQKKQEKERVKELPHDEKREYLREVPGQLYSITKRDYDGKGNDKLLASEEEEEPTKELIVARYAEIYGGGDYIVNAYKPFGKMRFALHRIEGEPIHSTKDRKPSDPMKRIEAKFIDSISDADIAKIAPVFLQNKLGIQPTMNNQFGYSGYGPSMDPLVQEKLAIAQDLRRQGRFPEAIQALTGNVPKNKSEFDDIIVFLEKLDRLNGFLGKKENEKSEKAQEIESWGKAGKDIAGAIREVATDAIDHWHEKTSDSIGDMKHKFICGNCKQEIPSADTAKCPHCGAHLREPNQAEQPIEYHPPPKIRDEEEPETDYEVEEDEEEEEDEDEEEEEEKQSKVVEIKPLTENERKFLLTALPEVFVNRIKRHNGETFPKKFMLIQKRKQCEPKEAARYDVDYLLKNYPDQKETTYKAASEGFKSMIGKYQSYIDKMIETYEYPANLFRNLKKKKFKEKYPDATKKEIGDLENYILLKRVWDYINLPHAIKWWESYCKEFVKECDRRENPKVEIGGKEHAVTPERGPAKAEVKEGIKKEN